MEQNEKTKKQKTTLADLQKIIDARDGEIKELKTANLTARLAFDRAFNENALLRNQINELIEKLSAL